VGRRWRWVLAVAASAGIVTTMAGAHGGNPALIHACVNKKSKIVRIVAPSAKCKKTERAIDWPAQTAVGAQGLPGAQGPPGPPGAPGQDGQDGAPGEQILPLPPPTPYDGLYSVEIDGTSNQLWVELGGCFEREFGQEPEDCYLGFRELSLELFGWLEDTAAGTPARVRDLTIRRISDTLTVVWQLEVADAFITQARFPDLDAAGEATLGVVDVVVVPGSLAVVAPSEFGPKPDPRRKQITQNWFTLAFAGVDGRSMLEVGGVGIDVPRVPSGGAGAAFLPGAPSLSVFTVATGAEDRDGPTITALDLEAWSASVAQGTDDRRDGLLTLRRPPDNAAIATIAFDEVALVTALDPLPIAGRRSLTLRPSALEFELPLLSG